MNGWITSSEADKRTKEIFRSIGEHDFDHWLKAVNFSSNYMVRLIDKITFGAIAKYYVKKAKNPNTITCKFVGSAFEDKRTEYYFKAIKSTSSPRIMQAACVALADTYILRTDEIDAALAFYTFAIMLAPRGHNAGRAYLGRGNLYCIHSIMFNHGHTHLSMDYNTAKDDLEAALDVARDVNDQHMMERARERIESLTSRSTSKVK